MYIVVPNHLSLIIKNETICHFYNVDIISKKWKMFCSFAVLENLFSFGLYYLLQDQTFLTLKS